MIFDGYFRQKQMNIPGLNQTKKDILSHLLKTGKLVSIQKVTEDMGIPRQTVRSVLIELSNIGLVIQSSLKGKLHYVTSAHLIQKYVHKQKKELNHVLEDLRYNTDFKSHKKDKFDAVPQVEFYSGSYALQNLFNSILDIYRKGKSKRFRGYGVNKFSDAKNLEEYLNKFVKERAKYGVKTDLILAKGPDGFDITDDKKALGRSIKKINTEPQVAGCYIVANRLYLFSFKDNVGIMIENQTITNLLKSTFDDHWDRI